MINVFASSRCHSRALALCLAVGVLTPGRLPAGDLEDRIAKAGREHPRLLATSADFQRVRQRVKDEPRMGRAWQLVLQKADRYLDAKPLEREKTGRRLLTISRRALDRSLALGMAYQVTGDRKYLVRGTAMLETIAGFSDWNPSHFLDVAEMTAAMAIGYDWFFDGLSPELRGRLRRTMIEKGFEPSYARKQWWVSGTNNWNQVCHGGLTLGALAMLEDEPEWAEKIVARAVKGVPTSMKASYEPSGTYPEGPAYWNYGTSYNVILLAVLQEILGSDFGLGELPGFDRTGEFINHAVGPTGVTFNFADGGASAFPAPPALFWLARHFKRPDWAATRLDVFDARLAKASGDRLFPLVLLWMPPPGDDTPVRMGLDWKGDGRKPVTMHRSGWGPEATFLGVCAGTPRSNHGHMDIGSFVFESQGVRWVDDLGSQGYHGLESKGVGLWDSSQKGERWDVFRLNNFSHNTLTIGGALQRVDGFAKIIRFSDAKDGPFTAVDMSPVYKGQAGEAVRTFHLPGRRHLVVRDRVEGIPDQRVVTWRLMTPAKVSLSSPREAILQRDGRRLRARLIEPATARWTVRDASQPVAAHDAPNRGTSALEFSLPAAPSGTFTALVVLEPVDGPSLPDKAARELEAF